MVPHTQTYTNTHSHSDPLLCRPYTKKKRRHTKHTHSDPLLGRSCTAVVCCSGSFVFVFLNLLGGTEVPATLGGCVQDRGHMRSGSINRVIRTGSKNLFNLEGGQCPPYQRLS